MAFENPLSSFFFAGKDENVPQALRQKIALAMLMRQTKYPKTFGEGLASIGDSVGDAMMLRGVYRDAAAGELAGKAARDEFTGGSLPATKSYGTADDVSEAPAARAINTAIAPAPQPPPELTTAAAQPASVLSPQGMSGLGGPQPAGPGMNMLNPAPMMAMARPGGLGAGAPPAPPQGPPVTAQPDASGVVDPSGVNAVDSATINNPMPGFSRAISGIESGGAKNPYTLLGAPTRTGDRAIGKYQIMGANVPEWTQAALGRSMTPDQFRNDSAAQEAVFENRFGQYANKYGPQGAAKAWYAGEGGMNNPNATDVHGRLTVAGYGNDFSRRLNEGGGPRDSLAATMLAQQQPAAPAQAAPQGDQRLAFDGPSPPAPSGIRTAPPVEPQVRAAPQQQPGQLYITPKPAQVPEAGIEPMSDTEQRIRRKIENTPPAYRDSVQQALTPLLEQEVNNRSIRQKQREEAHKEQATHNRALDLKREDQLYGAPKTAADIAHINQQIATGKIIQMEGRAYRVQDDGTLKDITPGQSGDGPPQIKMTQDQSDTLKFYKMGKTAATQLEGKERLLAEGWKEELAGKVPFAGNKLLSSQYRAAKYAAGLLVQADLRDTSGATIGTQEYKDRYELLIPKPGDDALAMQNKAEARRAVLEGQRLALGTARPMADYVDKEHAKTRAEKAATLNREMEGKDKGKTYEKNGVFRRWAGDHWEEH